MAIGINDLDDDELLDVQQQTTHSVDDSSEGKDSSEENFMSDFLKSKGIDDPSHIKFEEEDGSIIERSWNDLSKQEKMNIANTPTSMPQYQDDSNLLDEDELLLVNSIRSSGMTPQLYLLAISGNQEPQMSMYKVDDLSDDELYLLDLETRVGSLTDEEAAQALNAAKDNEEFYKKQVEGIRKEYKNREDFNFELERAYQEDQQRKVYELYQMEVVNAIDLFNSIGNLDLSFEDSDKDELADFMLSLDENGNNYLYQALQDPQTLVKAAWFILNGDDAFDSVAEYFKNLIKLVSRAQYQKGLADGRNSLGPTVVVDSNKKIINPHRKYKTIEDLMDED